MSVNVGVDVSKARLDVHVLETKESVAFENSDDGIAQLVVWLKARGEVALVVMEATGGYEKPGFLALSSAKLPVARVNPRQVRDFAKALGKLAKTDSIDARVLALFASRMQPDVTVPNAPEIDALAALVERRRQLIEMRVAEQNRLKQATSAAVKKDIEAVLDFLNKRIEESDDEIKKSIDASTAMKESAKRLRTVPGFGRVASVVLTAEVPELGTLNRREIAALVGVAPYNDDSGGQSGKRRIIGGRGHVRKLLYMATLTAMEHNPPIKAFVDRLIAKGKPAKVAMVAGMRKLLTIANAMLRDSADWRPVATA
jgi:transposase